MGDSTKGECEWTGCTERCIGHVEPPSYSRLPPILYVCREHARQVGNMWNRIYGLPETPCAT